MADSLAKKVRTIAQDFRAAGRTFTPSEMAEKLGLQTYEEKERVYDVLSYLVRVQELHRVSKGVYSYKGKLDQKLSKQKIMWNYFRMRMKCGASVTIEELQAAAKVSADYAREWLNFLVRAGFAKDHENGRFQLLKDPVEMPVDAKKAQRLRDLRKSKREEVIRIVEEIRRAFSRLEGAIGELPD
ncbi:MAG: hypothetical protein ACLQVJ_10385 [Syntrophobacteraceae bacterium]